MAWQDRAYNQEANYGDSGRGGGFGFLLPSSRLALVLMGTCLAIFIFQAIRPEITFWGALRFGNGEWYTRPWTWITYQYLHGSGGHIFFNLLTMYFFIPTLERWWGWQRTLLFYTAGGVFAGICCGILGLVLGRPVLLIGASGSILAVIGAIAAIAPDMRVIMLVFPMTMRMMATLFAILYILSIIGDRSLSDAAHLGGLVFGVLVPLVGSPFWSRIERRHHHAKTRKAVAADKAEQEAVDRILHKVAQHGMQSLSWLERRTLKRATEHQRQRDLEMARRYR